MIALGLLAMVLLAIVLVVAAGRTRSTAEADGGRITTTTGAVAPSLRRWVDAGLLDDSQAHAIEDFETARRPVRVPARVTPAIEAMAYVGGVLLAVGAAMLVGRFWESMGTIAHLAIVAAATAVTGIVGALIGEAEPVARRVRGFLWTLTAIGAGSVAGLFAFEVLERVGEAVAVTTAATTGVVSAALWWRRERPMQHITTFGALVVTVAVSIEWIDDVNPWAWIGLALWALGIVWATAAWRRFIPPAAIGFPLGVILTLVGAGIIGGRYDWIGPILGLVTAAAWTTIGIRSNEVLALAPGLVGIFVFLPWSLGRFFGDSLGAPVIIMLSGAVLLAVVVVLWRRRGRTAHIGELWGGNLGFGRH